MIYHLVLFLVILSGFLISACGKTYALSAKAAIEIPNEIRHRYIPGFYNNIIEFRPTSTNTVNAIVNDYCQQGYNEGSNCWNSMCSPTSIRSFYYLWEYKSEINVITLYHACLLADKYPNLCLKGPYPCTYALEPLNFPTNSSWRINYMTPYDMRIESPGLGYMDLMNFTPRLEPEFFPDSLSAVFTSKKDSVVISYIVANEGYAASDVWVELWINSICVDSGLADTLEPGYYFKFDYASKIADSITNAIVRVDPMDLDTEIIENNNTISATWNTPLPSTESEIKPVSVHNSSHQDFWYYEVYDLRGRIIYNSENNSERKCRKMGIYLYKRRNHDSENIKRILNGF